MALYAGQYGPWAVLGNTAGSLIAVAQVGLSVTVRNIGDTANATIYTSRTKASTAANPVTTDSDGMLTFYADPGRYLCKATINGTAEQWVCVIHYDVSEMATIINAASFGVSSAATAAVNGAAITAAYAAATAQGGGDVQLPAGSFSASGVMSCPTKVNLVAAGPWATVITLTTAGSQLRWGDGGGATSTINYGGRSGGFRIIGTAATNPMFVGLCVARSWSDIDGFGAIGDGLRLEETQNCHFDQVNWQGAGGSGHVLDYGAGGNKFTKCEFNLNGYAQGRSTRSGSSTPVGLAVPYLNTYDTCLFEGSTSTTIAVYDHEAGQGLNFHSCHLTLLGGATGHAELYGTDIPVLRITRPDTSQPSSGIIFTGIGGLYGSAAVATPTTFRGYGVEVWATGGDARRPSVHFGPGVVIQSMAIAVRAIDTAWITAESANLIPAVPTWNVARFGNLSGGTKTEGEIIRNRVGATTVTGTDPAQPAQLIQPATGTTGIVWLVRNAAGSDVVSVTNGGTVSSVASMAGTVFRATTAGGASGPSFTWASDLNTGMFSPGADILALSAGGVEVARFTATVPDVTGSRGGNAALASLLTALDTLGLITDSSTA